MRISGLFSIIASLNVYLSLCNFKPCLYCALSFGFASFSNVSILGETKLFLDLTGFVFVVDSRYGFHVMHLY